MKLFVLCASLLVATAAAEGDSIKSFISQRLRRTRLVPHPPPHPVGPGFGEVGVNSGTCPGPSPEQLFQFNNVLTAVEATRSNIKNPNAKFGEAKSQKTAAIEAAECLNLDNLTPDYTSIPEEYSCLPAYCAAIKTAQECQAAFYKGCSYCSGQCMAAAGMQKAVIDCVRGAYALAEPNKVNGEIPHLQTPFVAATETILFRRAAALSTLTNVIGGDQAVMNWGQYKDNRPPMKRVPIHVHPIGGYTCVNEGPAVAMEVEGSPTVLFQEGECFNMQAFVKMTQAPPHDGYTVTDYFHENSCLPTWVVIEENAYAVQDAQFGVQSDHVCPTTCSGECCNLNVHACIDSSNTLQQCTFWEYDGFTASTGKNKPQIDPSKCDHLTPDGKNCGVCLPCTNEAECGRAKPRKSM